MYSYGADKFYCVSRKRFPRIIWVVQHHGPVIDVLNKGHPIYSAGLEDDIEKFRRISQFPPRIRDRRSNKMTHDSHKLGCMLAWFLSYAIQKEIQCS